MKPIITLDMPKKGMQGWFNVSVEGVGYCAGVWGKLHSIERNEVSPIHVVIKDSEGGKSFFHVDKIHVQLIKEGRL